MNTEEKNTLIQNGKKTTCGFIFYFYWTLMTLKMCPSHLNWYEQLQQVKLDRGCHHASLKDLTQPVRKNTNVKVLQSGNASRSIIIATGVTGWFNW